MKRITLVILIFFYSFGFAQSIANYDISVTTIWNAIEHTAVPASAHWSPLAGATHKNPNDILEFGVTAPLTNGIKDIAETGNTSNFMGEVNAVISAGNADQYLQQAFSPFAGNNSAATISSVSVSEAFPLITLVSMVAPSPDWFIAVNSENLRSGNPAINNGWRDTFTLEVFAYDSGTDSGTNYTSGNIATTPRTPITTVSGPPINGNRMATITFTYNAPTLSDKHLRSSRHIKIFPNPTSDKFTISNIKNANIRRIEIYTLLGKLRQTIMVQHPTNSLAVDVSNLTSGIYLLKLKNEKDSTKTQKLIVR